MLMLRKNPQTEGFFILNFFYALRLPPAFSPALIALFKTSLICSVVIVQSPTILTLIDTDFLSSPKFLPA